MKKKMRKENSQWSIGETGRSGYERTKEHVSDLYNIEEKSYLLKHYVLCHQHEMELYEMEFCKRIKKSYSSAKKRQVGEAVSIGLWRVPIA